jgi:hypothetical protein
MVVLFVVLVGAVCAAGIVKMRRRYALDREFLLDPGDPAFWERDVAGDAEGYDELVDTGATS